MSVQVTVGLSVLLGRWRFLKPQLRKPADVNH